MKESIVQKGKYCFITGETECALDKHHLLNGPMRSWADEVGLWVWLKHDVHMYIHHTNRKQLMELKRVAQYCYEKTHTREEWMNHVRTNYLVEEMTAEEVNKYFLQDTEPLNIKDVKMPWETTKNF